MSICFISDIWWFDMKIDGELSSFAWKQTRKRLTELNSGSGISKTEVRNSNIPILKLKANKIILSRILKSETIRFV